MRLILRRAKARLEGWLIATSLVAPTLSSGHIRQAPLAWPLGEIGIRSRLKICFPKGSAGSSPAGATSYRQILDITYFQQMFLNPKCSLLGY